MRAACSRTGLTETALCFHQPLKQTATPGGGHCVMDKLCHFLAFRHKLAMASRISALMPGHQQFSYAAFIPTLSEKHLAALHIGLCNDWHKQKRQSIKPNSCSLRCLVCNSCQKSWSDESIGTLSSF